MRKTPVPSGVGTITDPCIYFGVLGPAKPITINNYNSNSIFKIGFP
jgi:hypothetical protein